MKPESLPRKEDQRFLTGRGRYCADLSRDGQLHAVVVRSEHAHAALLGVDSEAAAEMPGVVAVHTAADLAADGLQPLPSVSELSDGSKPAVPPRFALARDRVRHVGDPIALVLAETRAEALSAAELVLVEFGPLPAVVDPMSALAKDSVRVWPEINGNLAFHFHAGDPEATRAAIERAAHVIELELVNHRVSALPMEPRAGLAEFDGQTERFKLTATAQGLHSIRRQLASVFGIEESSFWLLGPDVGGGFGLKNFLYPEWVLLLWAARRHGRPVKWVADLGEDLSGAAHGRDILATARLALDDDGTFLALEASLVANLGAYLSGGAPNVSTKALPTAMGGMYAIPHISMESRGVFTNTAPVDAYRGAGKPEANYIIERLIDEAARRFRFDPVELRLRNALRSFPHRTALGMTIDGGAFGANIERAMEVADRDGFAARREASREAGRLRGFGIGCFLETARGAPQEAAELRFTREGVVEIRIGTESHGQGHETAFCQIARDRLGLSMEMFRFVQADTSRVRSGHGHGGARSMHMGGAALVKAIGRMFEKARPVAAQLLQVSEADLVFEDGWFGVPATGQKVDLMEVASAARELESEDDPDSRGLDTHASVEDAPFTFPNGCHVAEVEVDPDTGTVSLERYSCVDDYGALINPRLAEGQVHGGVAQGIGQALMEHVVYEDGSGQLLSGSLMDYALPDAVRLPAFDVKLEGVPTEANPLGVKGTGQAGAIAAAQAVMNAIADALAAVGAESVQMPATSEKVWRSIVAAR